MFSGGDDWHAYSAGWMLVFGWSHRRQEILELPVKAYSMEIETVTSNLASSVDPDGLVPQTVIRASDADVGGARQWSTDSGSSTVSSPARAGPPPTLSSANG